MSNSHLSLGNPPLLLLTLRLCLVVFHHDHPRPTRDSHRDFLWLVGALDGVSIFVELKDDCFWYMADEPCERVDPRRENGQTMRVIG